MIEGLLVYAVVASIYSALSFFLTRKFVDLEKTKKFQEEMKELQKEFKEAHKANDIAKMDEINKKQMEKSKELPKLMFEQLKMTGVSLVLFFASLYAIGHIDPTTSDDVVVQLNSSAMIPSVPGLHIVKYDAKNDGSELKGEFRYDPSAGPYTFEKEWLKITFLPQESEVKVSSNVPVKLEDDMATRTEVVLGDIRIYGLWLFVLISMPVGMLLRKVFQKQ